MLMKKKYKTTRKYPCPYCDKKMTRGDLIDHITDDHEALIPEEYSAARVVYDSINKKNYGTCMVCGARVYEWDPNICRYKNICNDPKCLEAVKQKARGNHLDDPEKQKIMLAGRSISGEYEFSDGSKHSYVGSYEKKALEFMDKGLNIPGKDILTPGPVIEYNYGGETHTWILDILYIPAMLAIDCKDGGSNPNTRPMESYREKQLSKEAAIAKQGVYNYLRLTDNNFGQLLSALADIKYGIINSDPRKGIYINETDNNSIMEDIVAFNKEMNKCKYEMSNDYHMASPEEFARDKIGVCWDYVSYEAKYFKDNFHGVSYNTYYIVFDDGDEYPTHTFLIFEYKETLYYFESAFSRIKGIWVIESEKDAFNMIVENMDKNSKNDLLKCRCEIRKYNALDRKLFGMNPSEYMGYMNKQPKVTYRYSQTKSIKKYTKTDSINEAIPGGLPRANCMNYYVIPYNIRGMNTDDNYGFAFGNTAMDSIFYFDRAGNRVEEKEPEAFLENKDYKKIYFRNVDISDIDKNTVTEASLLEKLLGFPYTSMVDFAFSENAFILEDQSESTKAIRLGIMRKLGMLDKNKVLLEYVVATKGHVYIMKDEEGYFLTTPEDYVLCSDKYDSLDDIKDDTIKLFNDLYEKNRGIVNDL